MNQTKSFDQELENLNAHQLSAVVYNEGPLRIIAGAGSGKTRVITMKIAYLVNKLNVPSWRIIALTFTNKAAKEMRDRVEKILGNEKKINPFISTFHSFCYRVLREDGASIGLEPNFSIIDTSDQKTIVRRIIKEQNLNDKNASRLETRVISAIESWKNNFTSPLEALEKSVSPEEKDFATIYQFYEDYLKKNNYVDFNDLQLRTYLLFLEKPEILEKWANKFDHILVDEFQDTNELQFNLIKMLTKNTNHLTVVGDPDQTIYTWRGAKVEIILNFEKQFKDAKTVVLDRNYRSTKQILDLANDLIDNNVQREKKDIFTDVSGSKVIIHEATTQQSEARYVSEKISELVKKEHYNYGDFFILYRMNAWSREFEHAFENKHIPYQLIGGIRFRDRKVVKDATAYLKSVAIEDNISVERILRTTPKIGDVTIEKLNNYARTNDISLFSLLTNYQEEAKMISKYLEPLGQILINGKKMVNENIAPVEILKYLLGQSGFVERVELLAKSEEEIEYINAFYDQLKQFENNFDQENYGEANLTLAFLQEESLGEETDENIVNKVTLLTVHASKGLENKVVFVTGLSGGIFPSKRSVLNLAQLEEERRALYVAMTRAKERLFLTYVNGEYSFIVAQNLAPSKFIKELDSALYQLDKPIISSLIHEDKPFLGDKPSLTTKKIIKTDLKIGDVVSHVIFGQGVIVKIVNENQFQIAFTNPTYGIRIIPMDSAALKKESRP